MRPPIDSSSGARLSLRVDPALDLVSDDHQVGRGTREVGVNGQQGTRVPRVGPCPSRCVQPDKSGASGRSWTAGNAGVGSRCRRHSSGYVIGARGIAEYGVRMDPRLAVAGYQSIPCGEPPPAMTARNTSPHTTSTTWTAYQPQRRGGCSSRASSRCRIGSTASRACGRPGRCPRGPHRHSRSPGSHAG